MTRCTRGMGTITIARPIPRRCTMSRKPSTSKMTSPDDAASGAPIPYGAHFVFCDGRIKMISFFVHPLVHAKLANRSDNLLTSLVPPQSPSPGIPVSGVYWPPRGAETSSPVPNPEDREF